MNFEYCFASPILTNNVSIPEAAIDSIMEFFQEHLHKANDIDNWTGDINNLDGIFNDEAFMWLLPHIRDICAEYMSVVTTDYRHYEYNVVKS